jgi:hypothetical protein
LAAPTAASSAARPADTRRQRPSAVLGDHEGTLEEAKRSLSQADRRELEAVITGRWAEIEDIERQQQGAA